MPLTVDEIRYHLACGRGLDARWHGWFRVEIEANALRRLGLHPDQPTLPGPPSAACPLLFDVWMSAVGDLADRPAISL